MCRMSKNCCCIWCYYDPSLNVFMDTGTEFICARVFKSCFPMEMAYKGMTDTNTNRRLEPQACWHWHTHRHCLSIVQAMPWTNRNLQIKITKIRRDSQQPIWLIDEAGHSTYFLQAFLKFFELFPLQINVEISVYLENFQPVAPKRLY